MMKKFLLPIIICGILLTGSIQPTEARIFGSVRENIAAARESNANYKAIQNLLKTQNELCNKREYNKLYSLYKSDFVNNDGFSKDVYFQQVKDTWKSYPDITYQTHIQSISVTNNFATVEVYETASASSKEEIGDISVIGELHGFSHSIYYLEKIGSNWKISSENILTEKTALTYGDARYLDITLNAPEQVGAGKSYSTNLTINAPYDSVVIGSIGQEKITYPQKRSEEEYRKLADDNTLTRMFKANTDNINEYSIASVGITRAEFPDEKTPDNIRIYLSGMGFIMTRINVIPENNFVKLEDKNEQKSK